MRILVIGLDCAAPELLLLEDERLETLRGLMRGGWYGPLESVIPPITVPAWMCLATSQDPGTLGVYGFRNRRDHLYHGLEVVTSQSITAPAIWDHLAQLGKRSCIIGVPPNYPPRRVNGVSVGCFLTPDPSKCEFTYPREVAREIAQVVGDYPVDVRNFRTPDKERLRDEIFAMSRKQFAVARHFLQAEPWDYFQFVDIGLDRIQHGFWRCHDPRHRLHQPGNAFQTVVRDYYRHLDEQIAELLALVDDETLILVVSDHGAVPLDGGFCINQWLIDQGLLALHHRPSEVTPFDRLDIDWGRTTAWSEGGYYARVFLNVAGREPQGTVPPSDYERVRSELKQRWEGLPDDQGRPLGTLVFRPEEIYRQVNNVSPDLIVHLGGLRWRSIGSVGHRSLYVQENDTGPDDCNHAQHGAFILSSPGVSPHGPLAGAHLLDMAPTLLALAGYDVPSSMQGSVLTAVQ